MSHHSSRHLAGAALTLSLAICLAAGGARAEFKPEDFINILVAGGEHDNGRLITSRA
mgnify:CR=1 FL=1